jgi:hypothetical protein
LVLVGQVVVAQITEEAMGATLYLAPLLLMVEVLGAVLSLMLAPAAVRVAVLRGLALLLGLTLAELAIPPLQRRLKEIMAAMELMVVVMLVVQAAAAQVAPA